MLLQDSRASAPGKLKPEKSPSFNHRLRSKPTVWSFLFFLVFIFFYLLSPPPSTPSSRHLAATSSNFYGGPHWEKQLQNQHILAHPQASPFYSVYGLNTKVPFSEKDRTDQPVSLYAATKKAGEAIAHTYNHIYGLSITGLRFFTVYGPWGRPDLAETIRIYEPPDRGSVARDFTYIDDIVKGCLAALDTAKKSTGSGGKKRGTAQFRIFNLGNTLPVQASRLVSLLEKILKLGYKPTTDLEFGLKNFVRWYLSYYSGSRKKNFW
ncbi:hypothetical protein ACOSP7_025597 [Xanthoceras sorbifolium]